jgi:hypothetical protein
MSRQRTRQPQWAAKIDRSNPVTKGLWAAVDLSSRIPREVVRNKLFTVTGTPTLVIGKEGVAINATASADVFSLTGITNPIPATSAVSVLTVCEAGAVNAIRKRQVRLASSSSGTIFSIDYSDGTFSDILVGTQKAGGSFNSRHGTTTYALGPHVYAGIQPAGAGLPLSYIDNVAQSGNSLAVSGDLANAIDQIFLANNSSGFPLNGKLYFTAVWARELTVAEIASLSANPWQIFRGRRNPLFPVATVQIARPIADLSNTGWVPSSGADLYPMVGETVRDDGTYISATAVGALCELDLADLADPAVSTGHLPTLVLSAPGGGGITVRLRQGTTTIATWTYHPGASPTEYTPTISPAETDSITDYTALRLQFEAIA